MIVRQSTYDAAIRERDRLAKHSARLEAKLADAYADAEREFIRASAFSREVRDLRARLAVFTAPRARGARGRWISTKGAGK